MRRGIPVLLAFGLAACGGGGGGGGAQVAFALAATVPSHGAVDAAIGTTLQVTFTGPVDLTTLTAATVQLLRDDGSQILLDIIKSDLNPRLVQLLPLLDLEPNERYRLIVRGAIQSASGDPLGADLEVCFITVNPVPTVRPDQLVDLGDRLNVPRYLARVARLRDGRFAVIGGFVDAQTATDTIEVWEPATRSFQLLASRLATRRAEHTVTLLDDGRVLVAGGVSEPDGDPLATTELFDPGNGGVGPGPPLREARRWHAASSFLGGQSVMVSGGFGASGVALTSAEFLEGNVWNPVPGALDVPTAQHVQAVFGVNQVYIGVGNFAGLGARFDGVELRARQEPDARFRAAAVQVDGSRVFVVGGDTRSIAIYDFNLDFTWLANDLLFDRRGAHTLTARGASGRRFLAAGGFQISAGGRALQSLEIVDYVPGGAGRPDALVYTVENVQLPVPFAGHVGFRDPGGATVLAGGFGEGLHSRRVVMVLDSLSSGPAECE